MENFHEVRRARDIRVTTGYVFDDALEYVIQQILVPVRARDPRFDRKHDKNADFLIRNALVYGIKKLKFPLKDDEIFGYVRRLIEASGASEEFLPNVFYAADRVEIKNQALKLIKIAGKYY